MPDLFSRSLRGYKRSDVECAVAHIIQFGMAPEEIQQLMFATGFSGYDPDEVDNWLDQAAAGNVVVPSEYTGPPLP